MKKKEVKPGKQLSLFDVEDQKVVDKLLDGVKKRENEKTDKSKID
jgi:hypothetical protein